MGQYEVANDFTFRETYPFNNKFVTVAVSTTDLRGSFISEAKTQKCHPSRIRNMNSVLEFGIDSHNAPENNETKAGGFVTFDEQNAFCQLNIARAIELADKGNESPYFRIPKNITAEAKDSAVLQVLDAIWRHERQHLIQLLKNQKDYSVGEVNRRYDGYKSVEKRAKNLKLLGIGGALASIVLPPEYAVPSIIACVSTSIVGSLVEQHIIRKKCFKDPVEADAYKYNHSDLFTGLSPFKVHFES